MGTVSKGCLFGWLLGHEDKPCEPPATKDTLFPYKAKDYFFTKTERSFYEILRTAAPADLTLFAKVRLIDLLYLPGGTHNIQSWKNRVASKHVDFVFCEPSQFRPVLVIELDDSSHDTDVRKIATNS